MGYIKQSLLSQGVNLDDVESQVELMRSLGNQQEIKKIYENIDIYISDDEFEYSIWKVEANEVTLEWYKGKQEEEEEYENLTEFVIENRSNKRPIIKPNDLIELMIPVISREEVKGFLCIHKENTKQETMKKVYVIINTLGFIFQYYQMIHESRGLAMIDTLTGLYNERHFHVLASIDIEKVERYKKPLTSLGIKIKNYQEIINKIGFENNEKLLRFFTKCLKKSTRKTDMPSRISSEKFAILMYETDRAGAEIFLNRFKNILRVETLKVDDYEIKIGIEHKIVEYERGMTAEKLVSETKEV